MDTNHIRTFGSSIYDRYFTMKVLITGGAGYIGSILTKKLLDRGYEVTVYDNLMYKQLSLVHFINDPKFTFVQGDVTNYDKLGQYVSKADVIFPLAAIVGFPACEQNPKLAWDVNFMQQVAIKDKTNTAHMVVFPTTNSGYGIGQEGIYCDEDTPLNPISVYGQTKVKAEEMWLKTGRAVTLRFATCFGISPRMRLDLLVNDFTYKALTDRYLVLFEKDFKRNFLHVADAANAFLFVIDHYADCVGKCFNVGLSDANLSKLELAKQIQQHIPTLDIFESKSGTDPDKRNYIVSNARFEGLGWRPEHNLDTGITELIRAYQLLAATNNSHFTNL